MSTPSPGDVGRLPQGAQQPTDPGGTFEPPEIDVKVETHLAHDTIKADTSLIETKREAVKPNRQDSQSPQLTHPSKADDPSAEQQIRRMPGLKKVLFPKRTFVSIYEELVEEHVDEEWQQALLDMNRDREDEEYEENPTSLEGLSEKSLEALKVLHQYLKAVAGMLILTRKIEGIIGAGEALGRTIAISEDLPAIAKTMMSEAAKIHARFPSQQALKEVLDLFVSYASSPLGKTSPAAAIHLGVNAALFGVILRDFDGLMMTKEVANSLEEIFEKLEEGMRVLGLKSFWPDLLAGLCLSCVIVTAAVQTLAFTEEDKKNYLQPATLDALATPSPNSLEEHFLDLFDLGDMRSDRANELSMILPGLVFGFCSQPLSDKMEKVAKKELKGPQVAEKLQQMLMQGRGSSIPAHLARVAYQSRLDIISRDNGAQHASVLMLQNFLKTLLDVDDVWLKKAQETLFKAAAMMRQGVGTAFDSTDQMFGDILSQA